MQTLAIEILNNKAVKLLEDLEVLHLIRVLKEKKIVSKRPNGGKTYKGKMSKQSINEIDKQLNELRNGWE